MHCQTLGVRPLHFFCRKLSAPSTPQEAHNWDIGYCVVKQFGAMTPGVSGCARGWHSCLDCVLSCYLSGNCAAKMK